MFNVEEYKPLKDKVLLKLVTSEEYTTESGLVMPVLPEEFLTRETRTAHVLACGLECDELKSGDKVALSRYAGKAIKIEGIEYILVKESEIYGIYE